MIDWWIVVDGISVENRDTQQVGVGLGPTKSSVATVVAGDRQCRLTQETIRQELQSYCQLFIDRGQSSVQRQWAGEPAIPAERQAGGIRQDKYPTVN